MLVRAGRMPSRSASVAEEHDAAARRDGNDINDAAAGRRLGLLQRKAIRNGGRANRRELPGVSPDVTTASAAGPASTSGLGFSRARRVRRSWYLPRTRHVDPDLPAESRTRQRRHGVIAAFAASPAEEI